jgi:hypothetical protein
MSKSKYDKNMDKGAAQQRNHSQSPMGGGSKPGTMPDEMMGTTQPGGVKNPNDPKRNQESAWRQKPGGGKG